MRKAGGSCKIKSRDTSHVLIAQPQPLTSVSLFDRFLLAGSFPNVELGAQESLKHISSRSGHS